MTKRRTGEFLRHLFEILLAHPDGVQARDALNELETRVTLSPYEAGSYANGDRRFEKIVRFATVDCVKAGWPTKQRGRWKVTDQGLEAYNQRRDPEDFYREAVRLYNAWRRSQQEAEPDPEAEADDVASDKAASVTFEQAEEQAWKEIEAYLRGMNPYEFQDLVADLLRAMGYHVAWVAPPGKDGGVDILAWADPLGTRPPRIKVQVKRLGANVNVEGLRSFMAILGEEDVGLFVTTAGFTRDAADEARTQEKRQVTLVDLERLFDLWVEYYPKLSDQARRRLPLQQLWFLAPES